MKITNNRKDGFEEFENDRKILKKEATTSNVGGNFD